MPGKDQKKEPNQLYFNLMNFADERIKKAVEQSKEESGVTRADGHNKTRVLEEIARAIAYNQIAEENGYGKLDNLQLMEKGKKAVDESIDRKSKVMKSKQFQMVFNSMSNTELYHFLREPSKKPGEPGKPFESFIPFAERYIQRVKELTPVMEQRERLGVLVTDLENSTSKSFTGKLKSIFVGNSKQYKNALGAMKALSEGRVEPDKMDAAKKAIKDYILARGGKERDHQYGRDRFDAFMKGLGEIMTPQEFVQCCREVNNKREATYGNPSYNIKPDFYLRGEKLYAVKEEETKILNAEKQALHERNSTAKITDEGQEKAHATNVRRDKIKELTKNEKDIASKDAKKISSDALLIASDAKPSSGMTIPERDQFYLDRIREAAVLVKDSNGQKDISGLIRKVGERSEQHPAFRLVAQKLIRDKGLTKRFGYKETFTRQMDEDTLRGLEMQVDRLLEQDRKKHPDDPIEDVEVRGRGLKELQDLEGIQNAEDLEIKRLKESTQTLNPNANQTKTTETKTVDKQAGGDIGLGG